MMNSGKTLVATVLMIISLVFIGCSKGAPKTISPAEFYKGKTIDLITTGSPGGYDDLLSHVVAIYLGKDTGSIVKIINKQGAGGMEGMDFLYKDDPDGLTLGNVAATKFVGNKVMKEPTAEYEIDKFSYVMSVGFEQLYFFVSPDGPYQSIASLQAATNLKIGAGSASGNIALGGLSVIKLLNLSAKVVTGIPNESDRALAVKRGEIVGYCLNLAGARESLASGLVKPLFVLSSQRDDIMPDVPAITELANISSDDIGLVELWGKSFVSSSIFAAPPRVPQDKLEYLRSLADKWVQDSEFQQQIDKAAGHHINKYLTGDEVSQNMVNLVNKLDKYYAIFNDLIIKYRD